VQEAPPEAGLAGQAIPLHPPSGKASGKPSAHQPPPRSEPPQPPRPPAPV